MIQIGKRRVVNHQYGEAAFKELHSGELPSQQWYEIREKALLDLVSFIKLVAPYQVMGGIHEELCNWWTRSNAKTHQLALIPRDHGKSRMVAFRVAWWLARHPDNRVLYISATANLAEKQLKFIKDILTSDSFMFYFPEYLNVEEGKRAKWSSTEIELDHPIRKLEGVRDPSVFTGGLTTGLTGLHCDVAVKDDVVVHENAYTAEGRNKVKTQCSLLVSIAGADSQIWAVGTRYDARDYYSEMMKMMEQIFNDNGEQVDEEEVYEVFERQVEDKGDGTGQFLWPRQRTSKGKWFGFDIQVLAKKRAQYLDKMQFRAQYYNDPNDPDNALIARDNFQYYDKAHLSRKAGKWYYKQHRLNVFAAIDFAYSLTKRADYSCVVVLGVDCENNIYVLDIDRFQTDKVSEYYKHIVDLHVKWDFRKIRAEVTAAQSVIVKEIKDQHIKPHGLSLSVLEHKPTRQSGSKEERMAAILEPRYSNGSVWHYMGGNCQVLEDELIQARPPHDDVKDTLASCIEILVPPTRARVMRSQGGPSTDVNYNSRFGGVAYS